MTEPNKVVNARDRLLTISQQYEKKGIKEYYKYLQYIVLSNKLDNLEETDKSLGTYSFSKLNQQGMYSLNR